MRVQGKIRKSGKYWAIEVPLLLVFTQGRTKKEAFEMAADAIECVVDVDGFLVNVFPGSDDTFVVESNNEALFLAAILRQQRAAKGKTVREIAAAMGSNSPNAYSSYENAKRKPSLEKFAQLLTAIDESLAPVVTIGS